MVYNFKNHIFSKKCKLALQTLHIITKKDDCFSFTKQTVYSYFMARKFKLVRILQKRNLFLGTYPIDLLVDNMHMRDIKLIVVVLNGY